MSDNLVIRNARRKAIILSKHLTGSRRVLDFGSGDLALSKELVSQNPSLRVTCVDIVDFGIRDPRVTFRTYNGKTIPFSSQSFDTVIAWHVFHHTPDPRAAFLECVRVAKREIIFVEPVWRHQVEIPGMILMDWLFNVWKSSDVSMAFLFHSKHWWENAIRSVKGRLKHVEDVEILPRFFPTGRSLLFVVHKKT